MKEHWIEENIEKAAFFLKPVFQNNYFSLHFSLTPGICEWEFPLIPKFAKSCGSPLSTVSGRSISNSHEGLNLSRVFSYTNYIKGYNPFIRWINMSSSLVWQLVKDHNSFLVKRGRSARLGAVQLSAEPGNVLNVNSFKYSGLAHHNTVHVGADLSLTTKVNI